MTLTEYIESQSDATLRKQLYLFSELFPDMTVDQAKNVCGKLYLSRLFAKGLGNPHHYIDVFKRFYESQPRHFYYNGMRGIYIGDDDLFFNKEHYTKIKQILEVE